MGDTTIFFHLTRTGGIGIDKFFLLKLVGWRVTQIVFQKLLPTKNKENNLNAVDAGGGGETGSMYVQS